MIWTCYDLVIRVKKRLDINLDEKWIRILSDLEKKHGFDRGMIIEIALRRSISDIQKYLNELAPPLEELGGDDIVAKPQELSIEKESEVISTYQLYPVEESQNKMIPIELSRTDVRNKHLSIRKKYHYLFPPKMEGREHYLEKDKMFTIIADGIKYKTHLEGANRLPHITPIFSKHSELQPGNIIHLEILEPKKLYRLIFD